MQYVLSLELTLLDAYEFRTGHESQNFCLFDDLPKISQTEQSSDDQYNIGPNCQLVVK